QSQGLPLRLEPGNNLTRIHARLDDLQRDLALNRDRLLCQENDAHAPFADLLDELARSDDRPGNWAADSIWRGAGTIGRRTKKALILNIDPNQRFDPSRQRGVAAASAFQ